MSDPDKLARFEKTVFIYLDAAYTLARWLVRREEDAEDLVQESFLRAFAAFDAFRGQDGRAWLLAIVRNTCYTWIKRNSPERSATEFDEEIHTPAEEQSDPETLMLAKAGRESLERALGELPAEFREVVILREIEGLAYKEISDVAGIPIGTVMSRLARARNLLERLLLREGNKEALA